MEALHVYNDGPSDGLDCTDRRTRPSDGWCAVVGGYVYRGKAIPKLKGVYVFGDNCRKPLVGLDATQRAKSPNSATSASRSTRSRPSARTPSGELYAAARGGSVYRLVAG